jgi:uncharacterized membrane protein YkoI
MNRLRQPLALITLLALCLVTAQAEARPHSGDRRGAIVLAAGGISMNQAIAMVEKRFNARVVKSETRQEGDRKIYVLRVLDDRGNGQVVRVDAATGSIL